MRRIHPCHNQPRRRFRKSLGAIASCCGALAITRAANGQTTYQYIGGGAGNWNDNTVWSVESGAGTTFPVAGDTSDFNGSATQVVSTNGSEAAASATISNTGTTNINPTNTTDRLTLTNGITVSSGAGVVNMGTNGNAFINLGGTSQSFVDNSANGVTISGTITNAGNVNPVTLTLSGSGAAGVQNQGGTSSTTPGITDGGGGSVSLVKDGTGTWTLMNNPISNAFTGNVTVTKGVLKLQGSNALGTTAKTLIMNGGTISAVGGTRTFPTNIGMSVTADSSFGLSGASAIVWQGTVDMNASTRKFSSSAPITFTGAVTNGVNFMKAGTGVINLASTDDSWSGETDVLAGTLNLGTSSTNGAGCMPTTSALKIASGATFGANLSGGLIIASISDYTPGSGGSIPMGNAFSDQMAAGSDNTNTTFSGIFSGTDTKNSGGLFKTGSGKLTLTGASTFNGIVWVLAGTLEFTTIQDGDSPTPSSLFEPATSAVDRNGDGHDLTNIDVGTPMSTIQIGSQTSTGALRYVGTDPTAASSNRGINLQGTTGGAVLDASSPSQPLLLTGTITATGVGAKTLTLTGTNTGANTLQGAIPDNSVGNSTSVAKTGTGTWVLTGASTYTGGTSVSDGKLSLATNLTTSSSVTITGGTLELAPLQTRVIATPSVAVTGTGKLDLQDNKLITATSAGTPDPITGIYTAGSVQGMVQSGRNGGSWDGSGIVTSQTAAHGSAALTTLAVATAGDVGFGGTKTFGGQTVNSTDTLVMYTYAGDTNLDGQINGDDYFRIDQGYTGALTGYENGDLNYDGRIDADDYFIIDSNYGNQTLGVFPSAAPLGELAGGVSAVPEPASMMLLALSTGGLMRRRRRR